MSQHSQRTQFGPSTAQIVMVGSAVAASAAGTAYVFDAPGLSVRELVACLMGAVLTGLLAMHTLALAADRAVARDRAERAAEREQRERTERARIETELEALRAKRAAALEPDRYEDRAPLAPPIYPPEPEEYVKPQPEPRYEDRTAEPVDAYGRTWAQAWDVYHANHPEVVASWAQQNGRWPNCPGPECNPGQEPRYEDRSEPVYEDRSEPVYEDPVGREVDQSATRYLDEDLDPLGYQADPERPWRAFEPRHEDRVAVPLPPREVPVSPGRGGPEWSEAETEVIRRPDADATEVIERVR